MNWEEIVARVPASELRALLLKEILQHNDTQRRVRDLMSEVQRLLVEVNRLRDFEFRYESVSK